MLWLMAVKDYEILRKEGAGKSDRLFIENSNSTKQDSQLVDGYTFWRAYV